MTKRRIRTIGVAFLAILLLIGTTVLAAPYGSRTLYNGTFGGDVVELQRRLASLGYSPGQPDGIFGLRTREAVVRFQKAYGLVPDGLATKWTYRAVDRAFTWQHGYSYRVVSGDSLWLIAQQEGTKVESIVWLNQLQDHMLYPGQVLRIPNTGNQPVSPPPPSTPTVPETPPPAEPAPEPATPSQPPVETPTAPPAEPGPQSPTQTEPPGDPGAPTTTPPDGTQEPDPTSPQTPDPGVPTNTQPTDPSPATPTTRKATVLGYYAEDWQGDKRSLTSLKNSMGNVDLVVNFQLKVDSAGNIATRDYPELMAEAQQQGLKVQGLVHNFDANGFDAHVARAVLSDPAVRARAVDNMLKVAQEKGLSGINIDIENVPPDQRHNYTALIRELSEKLKPHGLEITISIPAKTWDDTRSAWSGAFDYKALGQYADRVIPMAYDEHLPGFQAGPVASVGWVDKVAAFAASQMPAEKVLLGIPAYAYDWKKGTTEGRGLSVPQAMNLALQYGAQIQWDETAMVPYFTYVNNGQERVVYFENAHSLAPKLDIVKKYNLAGIGIWRLGLEDPAIWSVIAEKLN